MDQRLALVTLRFEARSVRRRLERMERAAEHDAFPPSHEVDEITATLLDLQARIDAMTRGDRPAVTEDLLGARVHLQQSAIVVAHLLALLLGG